MTIDAANAVVAAAATKDTTAASVATKSAVLVDVAVVVVSILQWRLLTVIHVTPTANTIIPASAAFVTSTPPASLSLC